MALMAQRKPLDAAPASEETRDLFAAYLLDEASREAAVALARVRGWPVGDVVRGDLTAAARTLAVAPPPRFMIVDIGTLTVEEIEETIGEIARSGTMVIAIGDRNDVALYRRLRDAGARDYLYKPVDGGILNAAFSRIEAPETGGAAMRGRRIAFVGVRGGVGTSTLAANSAWLMAETLRRRVALIDADVQFGTLALQLDAKPNSGLRERLQAPDRLDRVFLDHAAIPVTKQLRLFASEDAIEDEAGDPAAIAAFLDHAARDCDVAMVDLPRGVLTAGRIAGDLDAVALVMDPSLAGLRDAGRILRLLRARHPELRCHLVVNNRDPRPEVSAAEIERGIDAPIDLWIPHARAALMRSDMAGEPLAKAQARHPLLRGIVRLNAALAGVREPPRRSFWRGFGRR